MKVESFRVLAVISASVAILHFGCSPSSPAGGGSETCGDGELQTHEECEGFDLRERACEDEGFAGGQLACSESCTLDTSGCFLCGDGVISGGEVCDGDDLGGETCESQGYPAGILACGLGCGFFDVSGCGRDPAALVAHAEGCGYTFTVPSCVDESNYASGGDGYRVLLEQFFRARVTSLAEWECVLGLACADLQFELSSCLWLDEGGVPAFDQDCLLACRDVYVACGGAECDDTELATCERDRGLCTLDCIP